MCGREGPTLPNGSGREERVAVSMLTAWSTLLSPIYEVDCCSKCLRETLLSHSMRSYSCSELKLED